MKDVTQELFQHRGGFFFRPSANFRGGVFFALAVGAVAFVVGMLAQDPVRAWGALLLNVFFFFSLALGGAAFGAMQDVVGAVWGRPIRRLHESFSAFLPLGALILGVFLVCVGWGIAGADRVYRWVADPDLVAAFPGKNVWLTTKFMVIRDLVALALLVAVARWQTHLGVVRDQAFAGGRREEAEALGRSEVVRLRFWSAPILVIYALCYSLLGFDLLMSLSPLWFSTLWAGWLFAIMMQTLMAVLLILMFAVKSSAIGHWISRQQFHDVGKLMHGFTIFFAYLTYAHVLTYWYGNVPEETEYFIHRLHGPWYTLVLAVPVLGFLFPLFALLPKASKWSAPLTIPIAGAILLAQWFSYILVVSPEVVDLESGGMWLPVTEVGIFVGVLGLFVLTVMMYSSRVPMLPLADPLLKEALGADGHH